MQSVFRQVQLVQFDSKSQVEAQIHRNAPANRLAVIEESFSPSRSWKNPNQSTDSIWDWRTKKSLLDGGSSILSELLVEETTQGAILVGTSPLDSRIKPGVKVLELEYVESAPWNIANSNGGKAEFVGIGYVLVVEAILLSRKLQLGGRLGLHSRPDAEPFYRDKCQFTEIGPDFNADGLVYFEATAEQSERLMARLGLGEE